MSAKFHWFHGSWNCKGGNSPFSGAVCMWEPNPHLKMDADEQFRQNREADPEFTGVKIIRPMVPKYSMVTVKEKTLLEKIVDWFNR